MGDLFARIRGMASNKWAMAGLVGAAGLGAVALTRRNSGPDPGGDGVEEAGGASIGAGPVTYPNTYETDLAAALGDIDSRYADAVGEFAGQLGTDQDALEALQKTQGTTLADMQKKIEDLTKAPAKPAEPEKKPRKKDPRDEGKKRGRSWRTYTVKRGDSLGAIARRFDTSVGKLAERNDIRNPNRISAGRKIKVPGR